MALTFPTNPNVGDTYLSYIFDGTKWGVQAGVGGVAGVSSFNTRVGPVVLALGDVTLATGSGSTAQASLGLATVAASGAYGDLSGAPSLAPYAPLAAPVFTGDARAVTAAAGDNDTSIATTAFVAAAVAPATNNVGRNLLHNPLFNVAQRATAFSGVGYTLDRWYLAFGLDTGVSVSQAAVTDAQRAQIGDEAAQGHMSISFVGNAGAGAFTTVYQPIEYVRRLAGKTVTVSFWAQASGALKLGISLQQAFGYGGSPSATVQVTAQNVTLSGLFTRYSMTFAIPSIAGKTLGTSGDNTALFFWFSSGATNNVAAGNIGVQSGTINIWGVQLEVATVATPLEKPDPQQDLAKCQRFYQSNVSVWWSGYLTGAQGYAASSPFSSMRASPTITQVSDGSSNFNSLSMSIANNLVVLNGTATATGFGGIFRTMNLSADL